MTALNWIYDENIAAIVSDTLITHAEHRNPIGFAQKTFPIPHACTIIAGTGSTGILTSIAHNFSSYSYCRHVLDIDREMTQLASDLRDSLEIKFDTTIYVFGLDEDEGTIKSFAYRSGNGFASEKIAAGLATKPSITPTSEDIEKIDTDYVGFLKDLIICQKTKDDDLEPGDRLGIGGEIILSVLDKEGISIKKIHRFPDYPTVFNSVASTHKIR